MTINNKTTTNQLNLKYINYKNKIKINIDNCMTLKSQSQLVPMPIILEDSPSTKGLYTHCLNCDARELIASLGVVSLIQLPNCKYCFQYFAQSSFLSDEANRDISNKTQAIQNWIFNGKSYGKSILSSYMSIPIKFDKYINLIEDILILTHGLLSSKSTLDRYVVVTNFCKLRGSRFSFTMVVGQVFADIFGTYLQNTHKEDVLFDKLEQHVLTEISKDYSAQNDDDEDGIFDSFRKYLNLYDSLKHTTLYKKVQKFTFYILSIGLLDKVNIDFNSLNYSKAEAAAIKKTHKPGVDMIHSILDTVCFLCERGLQFFKSGDYNVIFHSGNSYEKWLAGASLLIRNSKLLNNPDAHGVNKFSFLSELKDSIEKGKAILKYTYNMDRAEKLYLQRILNDLNMIEATELTKKAAQVPRKDPFAVLIHGSSNICKSQIKEILFLHYAKVFKLPQGDEYKYTRCPTDEYWSGFNTSQWCIVMDDIAFLKPNGEVDPSLAEMLQVKNSVPYTPPQAALEDKGRTPVKAELLIATTNTKDLNLHAYFSCPFAIARRLSYVITPHVKPQFVKNGFMADSAKIPKTQDGQYMNIWRFTVSVPEPESDIEVDHQRTKYKTIGIYEDIDDLLEWYIKVAKEHEVSQNKAGNAHNTMKDVVVCDACYRNILTCRCISKEPIIVADFCPECGKDHIICECLEREFQPESLEDHIDDFTAWYKFKLFLFSKIVSGKCNEIPEIATDFLDNWEEFIFSNYKWLICCLIFFSYFHLLPLILISFFISIFFSYIYIFVILHYIAENWGGTFWKLHLLRQFCNNEFQTWKLIFRIAGEKIESIHFTNKQLIAFGTFISTPMFLFTLSKFFKSSKTKFESEVHVGVVPTPQIIEKPTFYYQDPYKVTDVDISQASKTAPETIIANHVIRNTARFIFSFDDISGDIKSSTTAINIKGNIWMFNKHVLKDRNMPSGVLDIILDNVELNISRNIRNVRFVSSSIKVLPNSDLAFVQIRGLAPGADIRKYFPIDKPLGGCYAGTYYMISKTGVQSTINIMNIKKGIDPVHKVLAYSAKVSEDTKPGDCGTLCIANIGDSLVILGSHVSGNSCGGIYFQHISQNMINNAIEQYEPQVDCGIIPISAPGYPRAIVPLHSKSTLRFVEHGTATIYGSFTGYRPKNKSRVKSTYICEAAKSLGYKADYSCPDMTWKPWNLAIEDMTKPCLIFREDILVRCENAFTNDLILGLGDKIKMLEVYTQETALNGVDGVTFVDRLNCSTSAGNPFKKSKKHFIEFDENNHILSLDPLIQDRIDEIEKCYDNGVRFHPQFCGHLKDEPTSNKKIQAGKTRVFTGGEFAWSVVVRKYLLSHIRLIQNNPFVFEAMPGIVAQSTEWGKLYDYLTKFGKDRIIAGDYAKFDKKMAAPFILSAYRILERLAQEAGWEDSKLQVIRCIAADTAFASVDFNGDLIEIQGNPSGHPLTVIINCIVNSLYMRYAFVLISQKPVELFKQYVNLATYGDDNSMGVSSECELFNHTRISVAMKLIGVVYTMADKEAESIPFIHIDNTSFLKRTFRWDEDVGAILAPLDSSSFDKMLTSYLDSGMLAPEAHSICVIETAIREYFFYGKDIFEAKSIQFRTLIDTCKLEPWVRESTFPTYEQLAFDFWMRFSDKPRAEKFIR